MVPGSPLPRSQEPGTGFYPEPNESILVLFSHLRLDLPSGTSLQVCKLKLCPYFSCLYMTRQLIFLDFVTIIIFYEENKLW